MLEDFGKFIKSNTGVPVDLQSKILETLLILGVALVLRFVIIRLILRKADAVRTRYVWRKTINYVAVATIILLVGRVWFEGFKAVGTFLGLVSAGLAIALKDLITDIAAWLFIIIRRPFSLGDRIQVGENSGDVIDIRVFQFTIMEIGNWVDAEQSTGRVIHIPNGKVFSKPLANYSKGFQFIWDEIPVVVTFESDWQKAKKILADIVNKHTEHLTESAKERIKQASYKFMIHYKVLTPIVYTKVVDHGVMLTMRYLSEPRRRRTGAEKMWENILIEFARHDDIDFAYPTQRLYLNTVEGKPGTKPPE